MFRKCKNLIFNSWFSAVAICWSIIFSNLFLKRIRGLELQNWSSLCFLTTKTFWKKKKLLSTLYVRQFVISYTLCIFVRSDVGGQKFVDFFFLGRCLWKNILRIEHSSILDLANSILVNHMVVSIMFSISNSTKSTYEDCVIYKLLCCFLKIVVKNVENQCNLTFCSHVARIHEVNEILPDERYGLAQEKK